MGTRSQNPDPKISDDPWVFPMLQELAKYPTIWDKSDEDHSLSTVTSQAWAKIADSVAEISGIRKTVEVLKKRWTSIRKDWARRKKKPTGSSGKRKKSKYDEALYFLDGGSHQHRRTITNAPEMIADEPSDILDNSTGPEPGGDDDASDISGGEGTSTNDKISDDAGMRSTSSMSRNSRKRRSNDDIEREMVDILRGSVQPAARMSFHENIGANLAQALDHIKDTSVYRQYLDLFQGQITDCMTYHSDSDPD